MNVYSVALLFFGFCSLLTGLLVWFRRLDRTGNIFMVFSVTNAWWGIWFGAFLNERDSYDNALLLVRIADSLAVFIAPTWLHFCLIYTDCIEKHKRALIVSYGISIALIIFSFSKFFIPTVSPFMSWKFFTVAGPLFTVFMVTFFIFVVYGYGLLIQKIIILKTKERKDVLGFTLATAVGFFGGSFAFPACYGIDFPIQSYFLMPIYPVVMAYFLMRSSLFSEEDFAQAAHKDKLAALGILTASINHEIRGPLFMLRGAIETETDINRAKEKILPQIERVTDIVSRLVHFAKKGVDEAAKMEALDLREVLLDIRPLFQHQLNYQHIEYVQDIPADLPKVMADRRYLEEILFNLILNACQALRNISNPKIELSANVSRSTSHEPRATNLGRKRGSWSVDRGTSEIEISISDNGPGISPEQAKHIFKPFHTTKSEGTGLGLYITKQLVEKCSGKIEVKSEPDKGAQFIVQLKSAVQF